MKNNTTNEKKKKARKNKDSEMMKMREEFVSSDGGNRLLREKIWDFCEKNNICLKLLEPGCFDGGIKRWGKKKDGFAVVYDYENTAVALAEDYLRYQSTLSDDDTNKIDGYGFDEAYLDAVEWIDYNTIRSIPYMGVGAPKVVFTDEYGKERVE